MHAKTLHLLFRGFQNLSSLQNHKRSPNAIVYLMWPTDNLPNPNHASIEYTAEISMPAWIPLIQIRFLQKAKRVDAIRVRALRRLRNVQPKKLV